MNPPPVTSVGGEYQTRASEVTPPEARNNEDAEKVNPPDHQAKEQHLPPLSSTPTDPATITGPSTTLAPSAAAPQPPSAPATAPDAALVQETYEEMSVTHSEAASTLCHRDAKKSWQNSVLTVA